MVTSLLVVEGRDDVAALTEILHREMNFQVLPETQVVNERPPHLPSFSGARYFRREGDDHWCVVLNGRDRNRAADRIREEIEEHLPDEEPSFDRIGLVFDPDRDDADASQNWLQSRVLAPLGNAFQIQPDAWRFRIEYQSKTVDLVPIAWDAGGMFDHLPDERNIERVAIGILQACQDQTAQEDRELLLDFLRQLQQRSQPTSWKTVFRLLNAICNPAVEDGFMAQVFGQDRPLRTGVRSVLQSTTLWERLTFVTGYIGS